MPSSEKKMVIFFLAGEREQAPRGRQEFFSRPHDVFLRSPKIHPSISPAEKINLHMPKIHNPYYSKVGFVVKWHVIKINHHQRPCVSFRASPRPIFCQRQR